MEISDVKNSLEVILKLYNKNYTCSSYQESLFVSVVNNNIKCYLFVVDNQAYIFGSTDFFFKLKSPHMFKNFQGSFLLEGYMYNDNTVFLVTDILYTNNQVLTKSYTERYLLICKWIPNDQNLLSDSITIGIHPVISHIKLVNVFKQCFVYKNELVGVEKIYTGDTVLVKKMYMFAEESKQLEKMIVTKEKLSDIYSVTDSFGKNRGILYVKGLKESKELRNLFKDSSSLELLLNYNHKFKKWSPQF